MHEPTHDQPTHDLGSAFVIARRVGAQAAHLHDAAIHSACGGDLDLERKVRAVLRNPQPAPAVPATVPEVREPAVPEPFGRYLLHECIGEGSMGVVYRATHSDTNRTVALKRLHLGEASDAMLQRFHREVVLLARLQHPGIVHVLDAGHVLTPRGREPFLAMELVEGPPLLAGVAAAKLEPRARVQLLVQLCRAIAHAHRRGVIHRDLKPDNVRLEIEQGLLTPRILDFGVATASATHTAETTLALHVVGTLGYMAPEQADGVVDVRCDVYSLGAIGYQLLTGRPPLDLRGIGMLQAIERIRDADPPPASQFEPRLRGDLEVVLAKALARARNQRYGSADEFGDDLERWLEARPIEARRPTMFYVLSRFVRRQPSISALVALLLVTVTLGLQIVISALAEARSSNDRLISFLASTAGELDTETQGHAKPVRLPEHLRTAAEELVAHAPDDLRVHIIQAALLEVDGRMARAAGHTQSAIALRQQLLEARKFIAAKGNREDRRQLAIAHVLLGDLHKENSLAEETNCAASRTCYLAAHPLFLQLCAEAPLERRSRDDLSHSYFRLAALDLHEAKLDGAEALLDQATPLVEQLARDFSDNPHTHSVMREMLGLSASLASRRGLQPSAMAMMDRMLEHNLAMHRWDPNNLYAAEFLLSTARSCAQSSYELTQFDKAGQQLQIAIAMAELFAECDPANVQALEERVQVARLQALFAMRSQEHNLALRHLASGLQLALGLRGADDLKPMFHRIGEISAIGTQVLNRLAELGVDDAETIAGYRSLLEPTASAVAQSPTDHDLRVLLTRLQVLAGTPADAAIARATLSDAQREGWFDERLWYATLQLCERSGEAAAALHNLATPPAGLSNDLRAAADRLRTRLQGR